MAKEIFLSTMHVLRSILKFEPFQDEIIEVTLPSGISNHKMLIVTFSITLTPGTSVISVDGRKLKIHCLTQTIKNAIQEETFINKVLSLSSR